MSSSALPNQSDGSQEPALRRKLGPELFDLYNRRVSNNQDLLGVVSDYHNRRGTGKTTACLKVGHYTDRNGGLARDKCTFDPEQLTRAYVEQPKRSSLILEEAERALSKYSASSKVNRAVRDIVSMGRVEQKYVWVNLPNLDALDRDLLGLFDVWILVTRKGEAIVHFLENNPYNGKTLTPRKQLLRWGKIDPEEEDGLHDIYQWLTERKRGILRGDEGEGFVTEGEHQEAIEKREQQAQVDVRNQVVRDLYEYTDMTQEKIGNLPTVDLSRSRVADILSE